jgi:hypothetical protein
VTAQVISIFHTVIPVGIAVFALLSWHPWFSTSSLENGIEGAARARAQQGQPGRQRLKWGKRKWATGVLELGTSVFEPYIQARPINYWLSTKVNQTNQTINETEMNGSKGKIMRSCVIRVIGFHIPALPSHS